MVLTLQAPSVVRADFQEFKQKVHEHHVWLSESIKQNKFGLLVLYDGAIAGDCPCPNSNSIMIAVGHLATLLRDV